MFKYLTLLVLFFGCIFSFGQTNSFKNSALFLEIGGSGGLGSINYERVFAKKNNMHFTWRAGLSFAPIDKNNGVGIIFPVLLNTWIGKSAHKLELGIGQGLTISTRGKMFALTTLVVGYRYQPDSKKMFYRVSYTPLISYLVDFQFQQWAGISIGYTFNKQAK